MPFSVDNSSNGFVAIAICCHFLSLFIDVSEGWCRSKSNSNVYALVFRQLERNLTPSLLLHPQAHFNLMILQDIQISVLVTCNNNTDTIAPLHPIIQAQSAPIEIEFDAEKKITNLIIWTPSQTNRPNGLMIRSFVFFQLQSKHLFLHYNFMRYHFFILLIHNMYEKEHRNTFDWMNGWMKYRSSWSSNNISNSRGSRSHNRNIILHIFIQQFTNNTFSILIVFNLFNSYYFCIISIKTKR